MGTHRKARKNTATITKISLISLFFLIVFILLQSLHLRLLHQVPGQDVLLIRCVLTGL